MKKNKEFLKAFLPIILVLLITVSFSVLNFNANDNLRKISFKLRMPIVGLDGQQALPDDSIAVYYYEDQVLQRLPTTISSNFFGSTTTTRVEYNYLIYKKNSASGYYFSEKNYTTGKKVKLDSLKGMSAEWKVQYGDNEQLVSTEAPKSKPFKLIERYTTKDIKDCSVPDSTIFYYTDTMKDIDFSLARNFDSIKKLKVCKIRHVYNAQLYKGQTIKFPKRELIVSFREDTIGNPKQILEIFDYYKNKK